MNTSRGKRLAAVAALATTTGIGALSAASPAFAGGNGAITETQHAKGAEAQGLVTLDFLPADSPALPPGCWANDQLMIVSTTGNAVEHVTASKDLDEFWFTTTYAGDAAVYKATDVTVSDDPNSNTPASVAPGAVPLYVGHLTTWFGANQNNQNSNSTATASFHGTDPAGDRVSLNGFMHYTTNASGVTTVTNSGATC